ncbi:hypothetical protein G6F37_011200 [Rhizopus arrhizus]|nr:hypothetical protein G6F38_006329 [Rhizopus arrhizus]KAG1150428.1 hypothetical protein G6F37_011200 [Rhizopus arrhizus]
MSHEEQPPAWASTLLARITELEQRFQASPLVNSDPNVVLRTPGADFTPSEAMLDEFPYLKEDFFRRPLEDTERRRYLFDCPKNSVRNYSDPQNCPNVS